MPMFANVARECSPECSWLPSLLLRIEALVRKIHDLIDA